MKKDITLNVKNKELIILNYNLTPIFILIHEWKITLTKKKNGVMCKIVFLNTFDVGE